MARCSCLGPDFAPRACGAPSPSQTAGSRGSEGRHWPDAQSWTGSGVEGEEAGWSGHAGPGQGPPVSRIPRLKGLGVSGRRRL